MSTWTPPATTSLSANDVSNVVDGLLDANSHEAAVAFVDTLTDDALRYVIVCEIAYRRHQPRPEVGTTGDCSFNCDNA